MKTSDFNYQLPEELIAQTPLERRDGSRLMTLDRNTGAWEHHHFYELPDFLNPGDCLILNDSRVLPARLLGQRYKLVMWDIISRDYNRRLSPRTCLKNVTKYLAPGAIVVFHDSEKAFRNMRYALPRTLEKIRQMGLKCKAIEL